MTPKGKERLLKLADILDTADVAHRKAKQPTYDQMYTLHECGTPACALGHWAVNNRRRFLVDKRNGSVTLRAEPDIVFCGMIGAIEFDLSYEHGSELFSATGCGHARTAKQAAKYIRQFVRRVERDQREYALEAA